MHQASVTTSTPQTRVAFSASPRRSVRADTPSRRTGQMLTWSPVRRLLRCYRRNLVTRKLLDVNCKTLGNKSSLALSTARELPVFRGN
ncbi:hypothetical protein J6590_001929 [Homalodisca vitripennis]|nr:hypothetical protein J6590_001929 [Homalodisca vitripennis]